MFGKVFVSSKVLDGRSLFMFRLPLASCLLTLSLVLQGCVLPQGAGLASQVLAGVDEPDADFAVRFVTADIIGTIKAWPKIADPNALNGWISNKGGGAGSQIESGDVITLSVWSNEENSLLVSPDQRQIVFPPLTVSPDGTIFLPYADKVYVAKMSPEQAREAVQKGLSSVVPSAQVQLSVLSGRRNEVEVISGTTKPGPYPLADKNYSILSLIALAGGATPALANPQVRLSREGKVYGISMEKLLANPSLDTVLHGGDKIYLENEKRYFLSLGAAGNEAQIPFAQGSVSALDAMSLIGGLNDSTANPKGILILREYSAKAVRTDDSGPERARMIFAFDLTTADGLFSAGDFDIQHQDLVLVTESPIINARTAVSIIGSAFGLVKTARSF
jgi:polysaccharide export outer membrane protein